MNQSVYTILKSNFKLAVYCCAYLLLVACIVVIVGKLLFTPPCTATGAKDTICAVDGWSVAGIAATVLGVGAAILTLLGAFAVATWWLELDKQVSILLVDKGKQVDEQVRSFEEQFDRLVSQFQILQKKMEQLSQNIEQQSQWTSAVADLTLAAIMINPPDAIKDLALRVVKEFKTPQIAVQMCQKYLAEVEDSLGEYGFKGDAEHGFVSNLLYYWQEAQRWYNILLEFYPEDQHIQVEELQVSDTGEVTLQKPESVISLKKKMQEYEPRVEAWRNQYVPGKQPEDETRGK